MTGSFETANFDTLLDRASATFGAAAAGADLVDVSVATHDTPLGRLLLAATPAGLVRVAFDTESRDDVMAQLARAVSPRIVEVPGGALDHVRRELDEYFSGRRRSFDLAVDLQLARGDFRPLVLAQLREIPYGATWSYGELAAAAGRPTAIRAAGTGCATNPVPLVVPCHRVLRTGGALGGYIGGIERKAWLLEHERAGD